MGRWFKAVYFAGILIEMAVRIPYDRQRRRIRKIDQRVSATERGLLGGLLLGMFVLPLVYSVTPWLNFADYRLSSAAKARAGWLGSALLAASIWLFWRAHRDLGTNWSPSLEIGEGQTLTTEGIYRHIRHPMYASQWLWSAAQALLLPNWIAGWSSFASFLPFYLSRVPNEERMMLEHFGEAYRAYAERTGRVLPRLRG